MSSTQPTNYNIIVMSDPQPWRLKDIDNNDPNDDQSRWGSTIKKIRDNIQLLHREKWN
ncbi:hypothetical protein [Proteus appendicitidis]|uniref:Uncharacterized protein n=1 Tax=Proteus appendicitidis TaxID=3034648 RepID=A0ABY8Y905_9GAMM|nr:hypothetical protein [Proteus sp. HZ0627]WIV88432.1 hypothetical protein QQS39_18595 [Proteus sp. HZ0627]